MRADRAKKEKYIYVTDTGRMGNYRGTWNCTFYRCDWEKNADVTKLYDSCCLGGIGIIYANDFLASQEIAISVGLNPVSLLTIGILGIGGFALLYGILACKFL